MGNAKHHLVVIAMLSGIVIRIRNKKKPGDTGLFLESGNLLNVDLAHQVLAGDFAHAGIILVDLPGLRLVGFTPSCHEFVVFFLVRLQLAAVGLFNHQEQVGVAALRQLAAVDGKILDLAEFHCNLVGRYPGVTQTFEVIVTHVGIDLYPCDVPECVAHVIVRKRLQLGQRGR